MIKPSHQIAFWLFIFLLLNLLFGQKWSSYLDAFYFTAMLIPLAIASSYFFNYFLVPRYFFQKQYFRFGLYTCYTIIVSIFLSQVIVIFSFVILANFNWSKLDPAITDVLQLDLVIYCIVFLFAIIHLLRSHLKNNEQILQLTEVIESNLQKTINVKSNRQSVSIVIDDIFYVESLSDYVKINTKPEPVITRERISQLEKQLPDHFIRCHRSFLVNQKYVRSFGYDYVMMESGKVPIGRKYRKAVLTKMKEVE